MSKDKKQPTAPTTTPKAATPPKKRALAAAKAQAVTDLHGMAQLLSARPEAARLVKQTQRALREVKKL